MNIQAEKLKLIEWLIRINDTSILSQVKEIMDNSTDQLNIISSEELIKRAIIANQDIANGNVHTPEDVMAEDLD